MAVPISIAHTNLSRRYRVALEKYSRRHYRAALDDAVALIDEGYAHANSLAGLVFERGGDGVPQDFDKALFYYSRAVDTVGALEGWLGLGRLHYFGKGRPPNFEKAMYYFSVANEDAGSAVASLMLGHMYRFGQGVESNLSKAYEYYEKASRLGSLHGLGCMGVVLQLQGRWLHGLVLRVRAGILGFALSLRDSSNPRLRTY